MKMANGEWEHFHGITIETTDTPGWMMRIDLPEKSAGEPECVEEWIKKIQPAEGMLDQRVSVLYVPRLTALMKAASI